jgi:predicted nucleic acid-binding protein
VATYFADTSFWIGLSSKRDQHHHRAVAWHQFVIRTRSTIVTTEAVLLEWLNALSDVSTRRIAAESYLRVRADARIEVLPLQAELMDSAIQLYRDRPDKNLEPDRLSVLLGHGASRLSRGADHGSRFRAGRPQS